jgi:iron complex transport system substrate-binding protein
LEFSDTEPASQEVTVIDRVGRTVILPAPARRVVAIGPGALRLYVYAGNLDYIVGVEEMETGDVSGKPYMLANPDLAKLPIIGLGGPQNAPDAERLLTVTPDVIFSTYATDAAAADELQTQTGIPVVVLSYGGIGVTSIFGEGIQASLSLIGQVIGDMSKAERANAFIQQAREDLEGRTKDIPDNEKPTVYVGGLGARGTHGIESTQGKYALSDVIHAKNVVDETGKSGSVMIDKEKLLEWNPDYLFIDLGGYSAVIEDYQKNPDFYQALAAVQNGRVYSQLPYNYYNTNIDTAIADAYFIGKTIYPTAFTDIDPIQKADEIYQFLLGKPLYAIMAEKYGGFGELKLGK